MLEMLWQDLETSGQLSGAKRVSEDGRDDFYALIDETGNRCLLLVTDQLVDKLPAFSKIALTSRLRSDDKGSLTIKLLDSGLREEFSVVCEDLIECAAALDRGSVATGTLARLTSWRRLLEPSDTNLSLSELRGLIGELLFLEQLGKSQGLSVALKAWQGPQGAPHDFAVHSSLAEVKTVYPSAVSFSVSSVEQLDPPSGQDLRLISVLLAESTKENESSFNVEVLVERLHVALNVENIPFTELDYKIRLAGLSQPQRHRDAWFYLDTMNAYKIEGEFPRILTSAIPKGVRRVRYDIEIAACRPYEVKMEAISWI